uniref:Uncharacterized protein n=1 Tax=Rhizophora mucronata TaxID=61149 RepID=A0A2P2J0U8_RHIMU
MFEHGISSYKNEIS